MFFLKYSVLHHQAPTNLIFLNLHNCQEEWELKIKRVKEMIEVTAVFLLNFEYVNNFTHKRVSTYQNLMNIHSTNIT